MLGGTGLLNIGGAFFLQVPEESTERILHPAKVVGLMGNMLTAVFEDRDLGITECLDIVERQEIFIYFEARNDFLQQAGQILRTLEDELKPTFEIETTGQPASAESRQYYRVSTVTAGLTAELTDDGQRQVVDVSCTGFSVISSRKYAIGNSVEAMLTHEGEEYRGKVCVQSIRVLGKDRIRYGLLCVENRVSVGNMPRGLELMTVSLQIKQLRRLAGTG